MQIFEKSNSPQKSEKRCRANQEKDVGKIRKKMQGNQNKSCKANPLNKFHKIQHAFWSRPSHLDPDIQTFFLSISVRFRFFASSLYPKQKISNISIADEIRKKMQAKSQKRCCTFRTVFFWYSTKKLHPHLQTPTSRPPNL